MTIREGDIVYADDWRVGKQHLYVWRIVGKSLVSFRVMQSEPHPKLGYGYIELYSRAYLILNQPKQIPIESVTSVIEHLSNELKEKIEPKLAVVPGAQMYAIHQFSSRNIWTADNIVYMPDTAYGIPLIYVYENSIPTFDSCQTERKVLAGVYCYRLGKMAGIELYEVKTWNSTEYCIPFSTLDAYQRRFKGLHSRFVFLSDTVNTQKRAY